MCRRKRNAIVTRDLNDERGACLRCKSVHRLQFHHAVAERPNDAPTTRRRSHCHGRGAKDRHPYRQRENRRLEKIKPARQMIEAACFRAGKKRERDNAHCFLGVICSVTVRHPGRAKNL